MSKQLGENMFRDNLDDYEARKDASRQTPALDGQWHSPSVVTTGNLDHLKMPEAPTPVDAGLVERMLIAWAHGDGDIKLDAINVRRMTAALRVAADALLGPVTYGERRRFYNREGSLIDLVPDLLAARRARLLAPEKSLRRQIEENVHALCQLPIGSDEQNKCADFVLGLIAMLKQEPRP